MTRNLKSVYPEHALQPNLRDMVTDFEKSSALLCRAGKYLHVAITWLPRRSPVDGVPKYLAVTSYIVCFIPHEQICTVHQP